MITKSFIAVKFSGKYNSTTFDEREVTYEVGDCHEHQIIDGLDRAVKKFKKGEKSKLLISSKYAYGSHGSEEYGIPPQSGLEYTMELLDFTRVCIVMTISVVLQMKFSFIKLHSFLFLIKMTKFNRVHKFNNNQVNEVIKSMIETFHF